LTEQTTLRDSCNIESTELSQSVVYDIGLCKYKKVIVLRAVTLRPNNPSLFAKTAPAAESEWCLSRKSPMGRWVRQLRGCNLSAREQQRLWHSI